MDAISSPPPHSIFSLRIAGQVLGVVGLGAIGREVARKAGALGMRVIAHDPYVETAPADVALVDLETLLRGSDYVTLHCPLVPQTRGLINAAAFSQMKPTAYFINTSRGPIVSEAALIETLLARRIAGAGLDVYDIEPLPLDHPLRATDNAVITPHLGYVTAENYRRFYGQMVEDIQAWLDGKPVRVMGVK